MSGTVNYPKVIDHLTDVIKELNVPCAEPPAPAEPNAAERQADAAALLRVLLNELESHDADAHAAAAEHSATDHGDTNKIGNGHKNRPKTAPAKTAPVNKTTTTPHKPK